MAKLVWRTSREVEVTLRQYLGELSVATERRDFDRYVEFIEKIKSLPGFPIDYDPIEDTIFHETIEQTIVV